MRNKEDTATLKSRRLLPSRLRRVTSLSEGGFFVSSIITQIGRENKFSAEIFACQFSAKNAKRSRSLLFLAGALGFRTGFCDEMSDIMRFAESQNQSNAPHLRDSSSMSNNEKKNRPHKVVCSFLAGALGFEPRK